MMSKRSTQLPSARAPLSKRFCASLSIPSFEHGITRKCTEIPPKPRPRGPDPALTCVLFARSSTSEASPEGFSYSGAAAWDRPIAVRRMAFLEVGGLSEEVCGGGEACEGSASVELSARMWEGGYSVGVRTIQGTVRTPLCENPVHMAKLSSALGAKVRSSHQHSSGDDGQERKRRTVKLHSLGGIKKRILTIVRMTGRVRGEG